MKIERVLEADGRVGLWLASSGTPSDLLPQERVFVGHEQPFPGPSLATGTREAVCWSYDPLLANIETNNEDVLASCLSHQGEGQLLACDLVAAGKMRNGVPRWWCRTHQRHWGSKADLERALVDQTAFCAGHASPMSYVIDPPHIRVEDHAEIGVWCSMAPALTSSGMVGRRRPKVHVHVREQANGPKVIDSDYPALLLSYARPGDLFASSERVTVPITPPAAFEFVLALERGTELDCIFCRDCGAVHLDMGDFGRTAHVKHLCGNCGRDNTRSDRPIASTPLKPLHDHFSHAARYLDVDRVIDLDAYPGASWALWASTPAIVWTADRDQEKGIHVHLGVNGTRIIDDTFGMVIHAGKRLNRAALLDAMISNTLA